MKELRGKNCLITGAASGIGRALASGLAREGMRLFLADRDTLGLYCTASEIEKGGGTAFTFTCDVSVFDEIKAMQEAAELCMGPVDLLVNNAGIAAAGLVEEMEPDEWKRVFDVNTWSIVYAVRAFLPGMLARGSGHIVNTGSGAGVVGIPYRIQYVASKFAVTGLTEALYSEIKHLHPGINVSVICPSYLNTRIIDRTDLKLPASMLANVHEEEFARRMDEFKLHYWKRYNQQSMSMEQAVRRYIAGIKKDRLYIYDSQQLRLALAIKAVSDSLYRMVLRREGKKHLNMIRSTLNDMGIS